MGRVVSTVHKKQQRYLGMRKKYNYLIFKPGAALNALYDMDIVMLVNETIDFYICTIIAILNMLICQYCCPAIFAFEFNDNRVYLMNEAFIFIHLLCIFGGKYGFAFHLYHIMLDIQIKARNSFKHNTTLQQKLQ